MTITRTTTIRALATALAALALPTSAHAGSYEVRSCDLAGGAQNAWAAYSNHQQLAAYSICPSNGDWGRGIIARNGVANSSLVVPNGAAARQFFTAPEGTGITNVRFTGQIFRASGQRWNVGLSNGSQMLVGVDSSSTYGYSWNPTDASISVPGNRTVYWEAACFASSGCDTQSTGDPNTHYVRAAVWVRSTVVTVNDPTAPGIGWGGSLLSGGWIRGDRSFDWSASDNSGISSISASLGGRGIVGISRGCDYTRPQPCAGSDGGSTGVATSGWPDGTHQVHLDIRDAAGNPAVLDGSVAIDNTAPARVASVAVDGGEEWRPTNGFRLTWTTPTGQHAPITRRHYKLCPADGGACQTGSEQGGQGEITLTVPRPGAWRAQVWLEDGAGNVNASNASDPVTLRFDDTVPPVAKLTAPDGWIGDEQARDLSVGVALADGTSAPPSGIAGYSVTSDGSDPDTTIDTDGSWALTDLREGDVVLKARAISGAGKAGPAGSRTLRIDRTPPTADASGLPDPGTWQEQPATVQLTGADQRSGIAAVRWQLDSSGQQEQAGDRASVQVSEDGRHTLTWETVDKAGNRSRARQAVIRIDRTAPETVEIQPLNPNRPRQITATVSDQGSGIASGVIQLRPAGGSWRDLDTQLDPDATRLTATLDDLQLPDGSYELRAAATDKVSNIRTGQPTAITLPLRIASRVAVALPRTSRRARVAAVRTLTGRVTSADGQPISGAVVTVLTMPRTERDWRTERTITAGADGSFGYRIPAGPTRTIRFAYAGTDTIRPAAAEHKVTTKAGSTIRASRRTARLGQTIRFTGRLAGGPIPADGKVLELQAFDGGRWRSFPQVVRTTRTGTWATSLKFERTRGTYTYRIRARVFRDSSYPYETGVSRTVRLTIRGN